MGSDPDLDLAATFASQHGLVTRAQAFAAGMTQRAIDGRVKRGRWQRAERGVYALAGVPWTWRRHLATITYAASGSFASHRAAAKLLGVGGFTSPPLEVTVPSQRMPRRRFEDRARQSGVEVIIHEVKDAHMERPKLVDGILTSTPLRLAVDIGNEVPFDRYYKIVGDIRRLHGVSWQDLETLWQRHSRKGRNGCGPLHELLDHHFDAVGAPSEVIEARCAQILVEAGLPEPVHQFAVERPDGRTAIIDLAYPDLLVGMETEGSVHDWSEVRQADHTRRNNVQLLGWTLFHFTWSDVMRRPTYIADVVSNAIAQRRRLSR